VTTHRIAGKGNTHVVEVPVEGSTDGGPGGSAVAVAGDTRAVRRAQILPASRVRAPGNGDAVEASAPSTGPVMQVEKTNGHHTSHGADARRPVVSATASGQSVQARIPAQVRSSLSRSSGMSAMDLKPSKPLPTSDVWSRPQRNGSQPPTQDDIDADADGDEAMAMRGTTAGAEVTEPKEQQPWQPQAETGADTQTRVEPESRVRQGDADEVARPKTGAASLQPVRRDMEKLTPPRMTPVPAQTPPPAPAPAATPTQAPTPASTNDPQPRGRRRAAAPDAAASEGTDRGTQASALNADQLYGAPSSSRSSSNAVRENGARPSSEPVMDDLPTQKMPSIVVEPKPAEAPPPAAPAPSVVRARVETDAATTGSRTGVGAGTATGARVAAANGKSSLLLWPEPDATTVDLLDDRGYEAVSLDNFDALPRTLAERTSQGSMKPSAVLVDPIAAPITRRGLRILRGAAINAGLPIVVTAGIGGGSAESPQGPDPALLLQALTPPAVSLPRVLLIEAREDLAAAMTDALERQGMQVLLAATDMESINRASDGVPDVVLMDLMQIRRRRTGIVEWLRDHERLTTTPIVVYTALGTDSEEFSTALHNGDAALYLAERVTEGEVANRIGDLLAKVC
jgi:CheY-like chemotaxis protein